MELPSEFLSHIVTDMAETAQQAKEVIFQEESFKTLSTYLERTSTILREFPDQNLNAAETETLTTALESLHREVKASKSLVAKCCESNKICLPKNCPNEIENSAKKIARALSLIPLHASPTVKSRIAEICADMSATKFRTSDSAGEREKKYLERRSSLGSQRLPPLQGFFCRLTQEIMVDPMEAPSGLTFERSAIEKWFADGNETCPLTSAPLDPAALRPNRTLRKSIEEWKERNVIISVASVGPGLLSSDGEEASSSLQKLRELCEESDSYREFVTMEDYVPSLVEILSGKNREARNEALVILCVLAKHSEENKEKIVNIDKALESVVRSLARQREESASALRLLLELARSITVRSLIGNVHGCILLLVTMLSNDDADVSKDATELIEILSFSQQNVKQMAKANYFKPLLELLSSGSEEVKMSMAEALAEIELTDNSKLSVVQDGALKPLIQMLSSDDLEHKKVAVKCLVHISSLPQNGLIMLEEGAFRPLFEILYCHSLQSPGLREQVTAIINNLSSATTNQEPNGNIFPILESDEDVFKFFSLVSLTGSETKQSILSAFFALCESPSGLDIRTKLRQISAVRVLVQLCEEENHIVRANAVKLFHSLTKDGDDTTFSEHVNHKCLETLLRIIETSENADEISSSLAIIANLLKTPQTTQFLLNSDALRIIHACLTDKARGSPLRRSVEENAASALIRFTIPSNQEWQRKVAEAGIIQILVQILNSGTEIAKRNAALSLKQLSENSRSLSRPLKRPSGLFSCCASAEQTGCKAHSGICGVVSSFCILEAGAVDPLVRLLEEGEVPSCEASLDALLTLIDPEKPENGTRVLDSANAVPAIVRLLSSSSVELQGKCLKALVMIFQESDLIRKYGNSAQMRLVDITQMKAGELKENKSMAAKLLSQLGVLGIISSFF